MASGPEAEAIALFQAGRFAEAQAAFVAILEKNPRQANALQALGVMALQSQRLEEAVALLQRADKAQPGSFPILYNLGTALRRSGRLVDALPAFRRAVSVNARSAEAHLGLGNTLREMGERARARDSFAAALRIDSTLAAARYNLALVEIDDGNDGAAESQLRQVVEREPLHAEAWNLLGLIAQRREAIDEAIAAYERAVEADAGFAPALVNHGNALKDRGDLDGACVLYERAIAADPRETGALVNRASVQLERGRLDAARADATRALAIRPLLADAQYALGLVQLREHDFENGWDGYERRFETAPPAATLPAPRRPRLASSDLGKARRIAVRMEQGLGDQVLYSTLLPELEERQVTGVVELDPRLAAAYRRSFPRCEFPDAQSAAAAIATCDHELPIGSLPSLFRRTLASFDAQPSALLAPDPARAAHARRILGGGRLVGISWRSFQGFGRRHIASRKSIPLECFGALARANVRLVDLQYGDVAEERRAFDERYPGLRADLPLDLRDDIEGVLGALEACALVITASNVTAHFAGALGKRTWLVYLGANPPFHYWAPREDGRCLWYPSVEIVTDRRWTRWEAAFEVIAERLRRE
jgi:tetratricopeptide (TPR) repeat protein